MDLVGIRFEVLGDKEAVASSTAVSKAVAGTGTAATATGVQSKKGAKGVSVLRNGLSKLAMVAKTSALALGAGLAYETYRSVNAFRESRKVSKQTEAVIRSTGGAAGITAKEVADLAGALSLKTGVDDEVIQSGANMLLTFKNIRNEVGKDNDIFNQTVAVANDMAAALGSEPRKSAIMLGKALNDPIAGISALTRVGVTFDEQMQERITTLVEQGNTLKAQKLILAELTSEFGGSSRANSDAFDRLSVAWENLEEKLGKVLFPLLTKGARALTSFLNDLIKGQGDAGRFATALGRVGGTLGDAIAYVRRYSSEIRAVVGAVVGFIKGTLPAVKNFVSAFRQSVGGVVNIISGVVNIIAGILRGDWKQAWGGFKSVVVGGVDLVSGAVKMLLTPFIATFNAIKGVVSGVVEWIGARIDWIVGKLEDAKNTLESLNPLSTGDGVVSPEDAANWEALTGQPTQPDGGGQRPSNPRLAPPVTPKSAMPNTGNGRNRPKQRIEVPVYLNAREIARAVHDEVQNAAALA